MNPELMATEDVPGQLDRLGHVLRTAQENDTRFVQQFADAIERSIATKAGYAAQFDSTTVGDDPFDVMSHEDIWERASKLDPETVDRTASNWRTLGFTAAEDAAQFGNELAKVIGTQWQGSAATAAGLGVQRYANSSLDLMLASEQLARKVMESHAGVTSVKQTLPPPVPYAGGEKLLDALTWGARAVGLGDIKSVQHLHEEAEEAARTVMKTQYAPVIRQAAVQVPLLPHALDPMSGSSGSAADGYSGAGSAYGPFSQGALVHDTAGSASGGGTPSLPAAQLAPSDPETRAANWSPPAATGPSAGTPGATGVSGSSGSSPSSNPPMGAPGTGPVNGPGGTRDLRSNGSGNRGPRSGSFGTSGGSGAGGLGAGGAGGRGSGAFGSPGHAGGLGGGSGGSPGGSSSGGSGSGGSGSGGSGSGGSGSGGGGGPAAGRPGGSGMAGMGAMAPPGGRGSGGDDDVHKTPGYLVDAINGDRLVGTLPLVAPPVLGG